MNASLEKVGEIATDGDEPKSLVFAKNLRRAFLLYAGSSKVTTIDLQKGVAVATIKTGNAATRFLQGMEEAQARSDIAAYKLSDFKAALLSSKLNAEDTLRLMPKVDTDVLLHPEDTFAYALNKRTSDVTTIDQETGKSISIVPMDVSSLRLFGPNRAAGIFGDSKLDLIDLTTNKKVDDPVLKSFLRFTFNPDRTLIYALGKKEQLVSVDANAGTVLRSVPLAEPKGRAGTAP